jgi:hypothetical protein
MVFLKQGLEPFGDLLAPFMAPEEYHRFPGLVIDGTKALMCGRLAWGRKHHLLTWRAPHGPEGRHPCEVALVRIVEAFVRAQAITHLFDRLFLT